MADNDSLIKANPLLDAENYPVLRKKGIKFIEELGHNIWTDYNNSDPGITMLDAVCYAITDLAYRTGFDVKDLLAPENLQGDTWKQIFYTARKILHNSPLTLNDYRKMLIDIKGVRNAWIQPSKDYEVPVWVDYNFSRLDPKHDCSCDEHHIEECKGKLGLEPVTAKKVLDDKNEFLKILSNLIDDLKKQIADLEKKGNEDEKIDSLNQELYEVELLQQKIKKEIADIEADETKVINSKIVEFEGLYNVMIEYEEDVLLDEHREKVRELVVERLYSHRNLCEDFLSIDAVEYEDFGIGASISLDEYADPDIVLAQIFFTIYKYFTPSVPFHTIQQMLDKGYLVDEIFEGPPLKHGFINTVELEKTELFRDIRLSDIINEIADIKGIHAITYLHLPFTDFDQPDSGVNYFYKWLQYLKQERKIARIQPERSQIIFCKEKEIITYYTGAVNDRRPDRMLKLFRDQKTLERKYKLELKKEDRDFPVPKGEYMDLEDYFPVTYSLPICYGVSNREGLLSDADEKRKVQALQLRGYLLFFEQLLSDYLVQLNHLRDLFSFNDTVKRTYFTRALEELNDLQSLIIDYNNHGTGHWDKILDDFKHVLSDLVESPKLFQTRRNRFLNHMLARFSEDMSEYDTITRWLTPDNVDKRMIRDKIAVLKDGEYYEISTNRGKAYNYSDTPVWDTFNVAGAERRLGRLLGFTNVKRRTLTTDYIIIEHVNDSGGHEHHDHAHAKMNVIKLVDPDNKENVLLTSVPVKHGCCTESLIEQIIEHADDRRYFKFKGGSKSRNRKPENGNGPYSFELYDDTNTESAVLLATSKDFDDLDQRKKAFRNLQKLMELINNNEGLHLVEHLLLRPKIDEVLDEENHDISVLFPNICLNNCDLGIGLNEGEIPGYRKKIHRIPAAKCYDQMPWVLEYFRWNEVTKKYEPSILFQDVFTDGRPVVPLKFRRYEALVKRVRDLQEFGSERINYEIVSNGKVGPALKYGFIIHGEKNAKLAQSIFMFNKRTPAEIAANIEIKNDVEKEIENLMRYFGFELDLYCEANPCDNNEDPYSFRTTVVFPCWPKRFRDVTFRNLIEKTIETEFPAHIHTRVVWVGMAEMRRFENAYRTWLQEMANTELPQYPIVNRLIHVLNTLKPCGECDEDCGDTNGKRHNRPKKNNQKSEE